MMPQDRRRRRSAPPWPLPRRRSSFSPQPAPGASRSCSGRASRAWRRSATTSTPVKGTVNDANVYILEGQEPGGTVLVLGGTHPRSRPDGWPPGSSPRTPMLAQRPAPRRPDAPTAARSTVDPARRRLSADLHHPHGLGRPDVPHGRPLVEPPRPVARSRGLSSTTRARQQLAYVDIRNLNRAFPGRPNGTLTERTTCYAFMELIRREKVDIAIDLHEAELQYPVISTIVAHQKGAGPGRGGLDDSSAASRASPSASRTRPRPCAACRTARSATRPRPSRCCSRRPSRSSTRRAGRTDADAPAHAARTSSSSGPASRACSSRRSTRRAGPSTSASAATPRPSSRSSRIWSADNPDRAVVVAGVPRYTEVVEKGTGAFLKDPETAEPRQALLRVSGRDAGDAVRRPSSCLRTNPTMARMTARASRMPRIRVVDFLLATVLSSVGRQGVLVGAQGGHLLGLLLGRGLERGFGLLERGDLRVLGGDLGLHLGHLLLEARRWSR
ncbi:MAG: hypothetical protein MZV63_58610 [Marinilabiliales bacterium]|nr:hypothetical protein [Marinilabiliales bacterium]